MKHNSFLKEIYLENMRGQKREYICSRKKTTTTTLSPEYQQQNLRVLNAVATYLKILHEN